MRDGFVFACIAGLISFSLAQQPTMPAKTGENRQSGSVSADSGLKDMFESKVKVEWEALNGAGRTTLGPRKSAEEAVGPNPGIWKGAFLQLKRVKLPSAETKVEILGSQAPASGNAIRSRDYLHRDIVDRVEDSHVYSDAIRHVVQVV
jgi:hypothetical protein